MFFYPKAHLSFIASIDFQFRQFVVIISISAQSERNARYTLCRTTSEKPQRKENMVKTMSVKVHKH